MEQDEFLQYAQNEIEQLHNDPFLAGYFEEIGNCLMVLKVFQFITIGVILLLVIRFKTFIYKENWNTNRIILAVSGLILFIVIVYECFNYECMNSGFDNIPIGIQLITLLAAVYFYFRKKS